MKEEEQKQPATILVGVTHCPCGCGAPNIMLDINGQRATLDLDEMVVVFDQIGMLLEGFGVFDDFEEPEIVKEVAPCLH